MSSSTSTSWEGSASSGLVGTVGILFMAAVLACFAVAAVRSSAEAARERSWPTVAASVDLIETRKGCDKGTGYNIRISYSYLSSDGVVGSGATERPINGCVDEGTALSVAKDYPIGSSLQIKVNPTDPKASIDALELTNDGSTLAAVLLGVGAVGLIGIAITRKRHVVQDLGRT